MGEVNLRLTNEAYAGLYMLYHGNIEDELSDIAAWDVSALIEDWQTLRSALARAEEERDEARKALESPMLARNQPCGCVTCICDGHERCYGCGAKSCAGNDCVFKDQARERVVYADAPSYAQLRAERDTALAQRDRLMAVLQDEQFSRVEMDRVLTAFEAAKEGK